MEKNKKEERVEKDSVRAPTPASAPTSAAVAGSVSDDQMWDFVRNNKLHIINLE